MNMEKKTKSKPKTFVLFSKLHYAYVAKLSKADELLGKGIEYVSEFRKAKKFHSVKSAFDFRKKHAIDIAFQIYRLTSENDITPIWQEEK